MGIIKAETFKVENILSVAPVDYKFWINILN